jgi:hypothetical protein
MSSSPTPLPPPDPPDDSINDVGTNTITPTDTTEIMYSTPKIHKLADNQKIHNKLTSTKLMKYAANTGTPYYTSFQLHVDGGANRSITNDATLLINCKNIKPYYMSSAGGTDDIVCTGKGFLPWRAPDGQTILINAYYSKQSVDTIISPSDIVLNHITQCHAWTQHADMQTNKGFITFVNKDTDHKIVFPLINKNNLWYYIAANAVDYNPSEEIVPVPIINRLQAPVLYELMHARLGHPGEKVLSTIHHYVDGIPNHKKSDLYKCGTCTLVNATKRAVTSQEVTNIKTQIKMDTISTPDCPTATETKAAPVEHNKDLPGQRFHMDMGFVCGTKYSYRDHDGNIVTSMDGFNSYFIIVDMATRYTWVFLSRNKQPPVDTITSFLKIHGTKQTTLRYVRTDEGGELWGSHAFQHAIKEAGFIMEPTAPDASFQNGVAERPKKNSR